MHSDYTKLIQWEPVMYWQRSAPPYWLYFKINCADCEALLEVWQEKRHNGMLSSACKLNRVRSYCSFCKSANLHITHINLHEYQYIEATWDIADMSETVLDEEEHSSIGIIDPNGYE